MPYTIAVERAIEEITRLLGIDSLMNEQKFAATTFMQGKNTFIFLPTGYGNSLICITDLVRGKCQI